MLEQTLTQVIILLGLTVFIILLFKKLHIPASLGYLAVGALLGSHTPGPVIQEEFIRLIAEFGIVFLLFTIGLSFSMAQIYASRHTILGLGTAQVVLTTAVVAIVLSLMGVPAIAAFVIGAVFAQSSSTIIIKQLAEQGEGQTRHGRLGTTLSVFQDITAVPFVVVIPVLAVATTQALAMDLTWALLKAVLAFFLVFVLGRYLLKPFFHLVAQRNSAELFTLSVLFVSLIAAWTTMSLGLSMAFGAFLAGMMLAETEFKHQVESTMRPFKDVLLGLFFISIGMLFNPFALPEIWREVVLITLAVLVIKILLVTLIVRLARIDLATAIRTGLLLAVGGEFGFALLAIGIDASILEERQAQIVLTSVLFSMIIAPFLIRYNQTIAGWFKPKYQQQPNADDHDLAPTAAEQHVVISGYGRIGQIVGHMLEKEQVSYVALDMDAGRVKEARLGGEPVYYGDSSDVTVLEAVGLARAKLLLICHDDLTATLKTLKLARQLNPDLPILVRTRDEVHVAELRNAGATEVIPETFESGIMLSSHAMLALKMPLAKVARRLQDSRMDRYQMMRELFRSTVEINDCINLPEFLHSVALTEGSSAIGCQLDELDLEGDQVELNALVRDGERQLSPQPDTLLMPGDVLVLFGTQEHLAKAESRLTNLCVIC